MRGAEMYIDKEGKFIRDSVRLYIKPIWNAYNFFTLYANADGVKAKLDFTSANVMDRYILSKLSHAVNGVKAGLDAYDTPSACQAVTDFFEVLNNWYIRRNKERFWSTEHTADKQAAYDTLYTVLHVMSRAFSSLLPLLSEEIYLGLTVSGRKANPQDSVHLADFPHEECAAYATDDSLMAAMDFTRDVCNAAHSVRNVAQVRVRQPLRSITLVGGRAEGLADDFRNLILDEVNVKSCDTVGASRFEEFAAHKVQVNLPVVGKKLGGQVKAVMNAARTGEWVLNPNKSLTLAGVTLQEGEYMVQLDPKPEYQGKAQGLASNDALVILDLTVTPELEAEGIARDVVRMIQQARKDADLDVSSRIALKLQASSAVSAAVKAHSGYIQEQTLSETLDLVDVGGVTHRFENTLDDEAIVIGFDLAKVAA